MFQKIAKHRANDVHRPPLAWSDDDEEDFNDQIELSIACNFIKFYVRDWDDEVTQLILDRKTLF